MGPPCRPARRHDRPVSQRSAPGLDRRTDHLARSRVVGGDAWRLPPRYVGPGALHLRRALTLTHPAGARESTHNPRCNSLAGRCADCDDHPAASRRGSSLARVRLGYLPISCCKMKPRPGPPLCSVLRLLHPLAASRAVPTPCEDYLRPRHQISRAGQILKPLPLPSRKPSIVQPQRHPDQPPQAR